MGRWEGGWGKDARIASTCVLVLANGAPAAGTRIWGHVLVLANGGGEELGTAAARVLRRTRRDH